MTNEERDLIARFVARVGGSPQTGGFLTGSGGSVPQSQPLPPIDRDADAFIAQQFQQFPEARYRVTQTAIVQEAALAEMNNRVQRLQWELEQARHAIQSQPQQSPQQRGFFGSLFGGGGAQPQGQPQRSGAWGGGGGQPGYGGPQFQPTSPPPQPQYPPNYQPGMFQQRGSGFLGSALTTAAGVAGGMVAGNALMNAFGGHHDTGGGLFGSNTSSGAFDAGGVVPTSDPTSGFASDASFGGGDPFASGGAPKSFDDGGYAQNTGFDQGGGGGFDQGGRGGFDQGGGGGFDSGGFDSGSDNA